MNKTLPLFPETSGNCLLPGPAGQLELAIDLPEAVIARQGLAIICHPNPPDGGTLHKHAIEGYNNVGVMPARGGNPSLTDAQVIATVDWMIGNLK